MKEENIVMPDYKHCILGTITSILKYYNVDSKHKSSEKIDKILNEKNYKNVVLLILDGMGDIVLKNIDENGYFRKNQIDVVTSVYPSTTTAALTTYYAGKPPFETGWIAWSQYFKEYGKNIDMLSHMQSLTGLNIKNAKLDVFKEIVNYKTIFNQIEEASKDVKAYEIMPSYSDRRSKRTIKADSIDEITENIKLLCENDDKKFIMAYSDNPDGLLHKYGTKSDEVKEFVVETEKKIKNMCDNLNDDTIIIISADHGHKDIEKSYSILDYPVLQKCLLMPPSLESRCITFWVKENMKEEFEREFNKEFKEEFMLMSKEEFLSKNMLGFGDMHNKIDDFLGNYIAVSISGSIIVLENYLEKGKGVKKSTHCGLTRDEMEVPIIVLKK